MRLARRGFILGGAALLSGCATAAAQTPTGFTALAAVPVDPQVPPRPPEIITSSLNTTRPLDPRGQVRKELMDRAMAALDIHDHRITQRDRMYLVDFKKFSGEERLYEVDLHDRSRPKFYFLTAGASHGAQQGPNVLLDGLEYTNNLARERAIIIHGADYADPAFLAREGKLGRSYGCFSVAHADLPALRERMGEGRLLFAWA